jgi:flagellar hook-associated protein 3 FlgL
MRVADKMLFNQVNSNVQKNRSEMSDLQNQAATQKRINKPSDDPAASARVLAKRTDERASKQFLKNIEIARSFLEATDQSLSELTEMLMRTKELAIQQASDAGASDDTRRTVATELEQMFDQAVQIANRKLGDRHIFGGFKTTSLPFDGSGEYLGDDGEVKIQVNKDAFVTINVPGDQIFMGSGLKADGTIKEKARVPKDVNELADAQYQDQQKLRQRRESEGEEVQLRGPASKAGRSSESYSSVVSPHQSGTNILRVLKDFEVSLKTNDKSGVQEAIEDVDNAITQVVNTRASIGARIMGLTAAADTHNKAIIDNKMVASQLEDADLFQVVSDINKTDSTLKATMETSSKMMSKSLLDFLR